ncbi:hypothetical protein ACOMHN_047028 [Nucella lapillus]
MFSKLDAKSGYWAVQLDKDSQLLTTFQSPFGRYCFQRLPFGLSVSQDIFQLKMDQILDQVEGAAGITDDIVVYAKSDEEHEKILRNLMDVAEKNGLMFNSEKCDIKANSITFFGMQYTADGVLPDPDKVTDLKNMSTPTSKREVQEFLGFITYLSPFIENLADKSSVLRALLKEDAAFLWEAHHEECFQKLKETISEGSTLQYFDTQTVPTLQVDASIKGLGASITQGGLPVAYASKSLSDTETRYACIEREMLAIVFGVQRFHTYLYGRKFKILTDHKPLVMILQKPLTQAPPRLQRMMLKLQGYQFELEYKPGKEMALADTLSRLPNKRNGETIDLDVRVDIVGFSEERIKTIREETETDSTLNALAETIINGWPENIKDVPQSIRTYWAYRDEDNANLDIPPKSH